MSFLLPGLGKRKMKILLVVFALLLACGESGRAGKGDPSKTFPAPAVRGRFLYLTHKIPLSGRSRHACCSRKAPSCIRPRAGGQHGGKPDCAHLRLGMGPRARSEGFNSPVQQQQVLGEARQPWRGRDKQLKLLGWQRRGRSGPKAGMHKGSLGGTGLRRGSV